MATLARVMSSSNDDLFYEVWRTNGKGGRYRCTCPHHQYRNVSCKHIKKVRKALQGKQVDGVFLNENEI